VPAAAFLGLLLFFAFYAVAGDTSASGADAPEEVIHVTSDRLYSDSSARYAEFLGNVRATQGTTVITADRLKVYYKSDLKSVESQGPGEESIHKLESTGNVVIEFDNRVAKAEKAIYITESRILILTGPDASLTSGKNVITGEKITLYREDGRIQVESGDTGRVEALFYQKGKGLN
jgi:lipopolysaccharide export system protein LptA